MANPRTIARLQSRIQERAAYCLQFEVNDPRASFITITKVALSPDLTSGKIYYSVLGSESDKSQAEHMLRSAAGYIQRQVARVLDLRRVPHLKWMYDESVEHAADLAKLIQDARARDREINPTLDRDDAIAADPTAPRDDATGGAEAWTEDDAATDGDDPAEGDEPLEDGEADAAESDASDRDRAE